MPRQASMGFHQMYCQYFGVFLYVGWHNWTNSTSQNNLGFLEVLLSSSRVLHDCQSSGGQEWPLSRQQQWGVHMVGVWQAGNSRVVRASILIDLQQKQTLPLELSSSGDLHASQPLVFGCNAWAFLRPRSCHGHSSYYRKKWPASQDCPAASFRILPFSPHPSPVSPVVPFYMFCVLTLIPWNVLSSPSS